MTTRFVHLLTAAVLASVITLAAAYHLLPAAGTNTQTTPVKQEAILDRVLRTKTLNCAYWPWPGLVERDPNTGAMSGAFVGVIDQVGKSLGVTVQWTNEVNIEDFVPMVELGKVDAVCGPMIPAPFLRPLANFATPILYVDFDAYVRAGDKRFDQSKNTINQETTRVLSLDGSAGRYFANQFFPEAHHNSLPAMLGAGQILLDVKSGKADVTVSEQLTAARFLDNNPDSLRKVSWNNQPLITLGITPFVTKRDDVVWAKTLDTILSDMRDFGMLEKIFTENHLVAGYHYHALTTPYRATPTDQ